MINNFRGLKRDLLRCCICSRRQGGLPEINPAFLKFVLVAEDKRFWRHFGADPVALARAVLLWALGKPRGGASTITMQFVRTVCHRREHTVRRKLREILLAVWLERRACKEQILTAYLNVAYFGAGSRGVEAASQSLFRRRIIACDFHRQAVIAALLVWPIPQRRQLGWYRKVFRRARWISIRYRSASVAGFPPSSWEE